jgi:hypothetical protein
MNGKTLSNYEIISQSARMGYPGASHLCYRAVPNP